MMCVGAEHDDLCFAVGSTFVWSMCLHEHVQEASLCKRHAQLVADGELFCTECMTAGNGNDHDCVVRMLESVPS